MRDLLYIPENYKSLLDLKQTEHAITIIKDSFQTFLSADLRLRRVTAPLFVLKGTGLNDDLSGKERPVTFPVRGMGNREVEVVHSLAKWKRMMLADYEIEPGYGIYTDMNAIRPDEDLDNTHSIYVDQWDWERHIREKDRNLDYLKSVVVRIFEVMKRTEFVVYEKYPNIKPILPEEITFIHAEELYDMYPNLSSKDREDAITRKYGAVFIIGIGGDMPCGEPHDGRAPDYDDWSTPTVNNFIGLNGDILLWNPILKKAFEISSMGIRVDAEVLKRQLTLRNEEKRMALMFHQRLINNELPLSIGGGIGQSRLCMFFLRKAHIGEIQASIWPDEMRQVCKRNNIVLV
ncbi:aspartate--ammonia ligase [Alkalitalea saponilacus]|uniref:Aspartate--ammonia ligase n=1 Tax=Alkalitalea saponilacus TaxID=889453 RepID=A0A1T5H2F6_9BACT|nr:aspartate--ammonia ligase [Alkalitalea saponilacus]ASB50916.1 aspartate--ammonia ligase [Alkalitalea saponilacus]SKC14856.1 aspartate-ammonia ligase [Alkalitalea saponilacus]